MAFVGMDVEAVRTLAGQLNSKADEIDTISSTVTSQLSTVASALRDAASNAIRNADEQSTASSA